MCWQVVLIPHVRLSVSFCAASACGLHMEATQNMPPRLCLTANGSCAIIYIILQTAHFAIVQ